MKFLLVLIFIALAAAAGEHPFRDWMREHDKRYTAQELPLRRGIFRRNLMLIAKLNREHEMAGLSGTFGLNEFADLSAPEFNAMYKGYKPRPLPDDANFDVFDGSYAGAIPTSYDWRQKGAVSAIKNQGQCGSCWAFSTTEGVESAWFLAGNTLPTLAPQQIVDCDTNDDGCGGGDLPTAYKYVTPNGLETEADYPYTAENGQCQYQKSDVVAYMKKWGYATQSGNETAMQAASMQYGPLSICVDASSWQFYSGGIIKSGCGDSLDHCVQIVGWDSGHFSSSSSTTSKDVPYWIVRNSWGTSWGLQGYLYVERNEDECGIADEATYIIGGQN